jgi:hypothetical protein
MCAALGEYDRLLAKHFRARMMLQSITHARLKTENEPLK